MTDKPLTTVTLRSASGGDDNPLVDPARTGGGSRRYSDADIGLLQRIQELTNHGLNSDGDLPPIGSWSDVKLVAENLITGEENYNKDVLSARLSAEWDVTDAFQLRLAGDYMNDESNARQGHRLITDRFPPFTYPVLDNVYDNRAGLDVVEQQVEVYGASLVAEYEVNDSITLKNILAYREDEGTSPIDFDALPEADVDVPGIYTNDQLSNEFQLLYSIHSPETALEVPRPVGG